MINLEELANAKEPVDLAGLVEQPEGKVVNAPPSTRNLLTYTSLLKSEQVGEEFDVSMAEFDSLGYSPTADATLEDAKRESFVQDQQALIDILANPDVSDEVKLQAATAVTDLSNERYSLRNTYSTKLLSEPTEDSNNQAMETTRINLAEEIEVVNAYRSEVQKMLNAEEAKSSPSTLTKVGDFLQLVIPFAEQTMLNNIDVEDETYPFLLAGSAKRDMADALRKMPHADRMRALEKLVDITATNSSIVLDDPNDFVRMEMLRNAAIYGEYDDTDVLIDNAVSILDLIGIGSLIKATTRTSKANSVVSNKAFKGGAKPVSPLTTAREANPTQAKRMLKEIVDDTTGKKAQQYAGSSRDEVLADELLPQLDNEFGIVEGRIIDPEVVRVSKQDGATFYSDEALKAAGVEVFNNFKQVTGADIRANMSVHRVVDNKAQIAATYGPTQGGWSSPSAALDSVARALKSQGVEKGDLILLRRTPEGNYVESSLQEVEAMETIGATYRKTKGKQARRVRVKAPDQYLVRVRHDYEFNPLDVTDPSGFDIGKALGVPLNMFDGVKQFIGTAGSVTRHLVDPQSLLSPRLTVGASAAVERSAALERSLLDLGAKEFGDPFNALPVPRQNQVYDIIKEQNKKGVELTDAELIARGLSGAEVATIKGFRKYNDALFYLENKDLATKLVNRGMEVITSQNGTKLFAKPSIKKPNLKLGDEVFYDADTGTVRTLTQTELDAIYESGGVVGKLNRPEKIDDSMATYVISSNSASGGSYFRKMKPSEKVLDYRKGYYSVKYDAPIFITKKIYDNKGTKVLYEKAIAVARSTQEAQSKVADLRAADDLGDDADLVYDFRDDIKNDPKALDEAEWDLNRTAGRSAQRVRGNRLEDSSDTTNLGVDDHVLGPIDAMVASARSVSRRTAMRPYIEGVKKKFLDKYEHLMPTTKGQTQFPTSIEQIGKRGQQGTAEVRDARTAFEYINYLENGYVNHLDEGWKGMFNMMAKALSSQTVRGEQAAYWLRDNTSPTNFAKNLSFTAYLVLNPIRQIFVQGHQSVQLMAIAPKYMLAKAPADFTALTLMRMGVDPKAASKVVLGQRSEKELATMYKEYMDSGIPSSIDKQNLISGSLTEFAEYSQYKSGLNLVGKGLRGARKIGFDVGEEITMMTAWMAHRDRTVQKLKAGKKDLTDEAVSLTQKDLDGVTSAARNFTFNMNAAGDMPYNQNLLNIPLQFFQVPHKAMLQLTNRQLTKAEKLRVAAFSAAMYPAAGVMLANVFGDGFWEGVPEEVKPILEQGFESAMLNGALTALSGEEVRTDWSSLAPYDAGMLEHIIELVGSDVGSMFANTPSGQLFLGANPRFTQLGEAVARLVNPYDEYESPNEFLDVVEGFLSLSSGYNNAEKAAYALKTGQVLDSMGNVSDEHVTRLEAMMLSFGFPTIDQAFSYSLGKKVGDKKKEAKEQAKKIYQDLRRHVLQNTDNADFDFQVKAVNEAYRMFPDADLVRQELMNLIRFDARKGHALFPLAVMKTQGILTSDERKAFIRQLPNVDEATKQRMLEVEDTLNNQSENKE